MISGILCMDKPEGFTSFDVVAKMRGILRQKKIGHAGTLDPMATGVLPLFLGTATRACDLLPDAGKAYTARFQLGVTTDTQDCTGNILSKAQSTVTREEVLAAMERFTGELWQVPPMYSAVKIGGKKLYEIARKGQEIERPARPVTVYEMTLLSFDEQRGEGEFTVSCSKGTYVRTLCHDLGQALGPGGILTGLRRTKAAGFTLADCYTFPQVEELASRGGEALASAIFPVDRVFQSLPALYLSSAQARMFVNGVKLQLNRLPLLAKEGRHRVYGRENAGEPVFLGLASPDFEQKELRIDKLFYQREG